MDIGFSLMIFGCLVLCGWVGHNTGYKEGKKDQLEENQKLFKDMEKHLDKVHIQLEASKDLKQQFEGYRTMLRYLRDNRFNHKFVVQILEKFDG